MAGVSQTRSIVYNNNNNTSTYIKKAKQHVDPHMSTHHQDWSHDETPLTSEQVEEIFWRKLVNKGWKLDLETKHIGIVLLCPNCEEVVDRYKFIRATSIANLIKDSYIAAVIAIHNGKPCKP